jgi:hypothetical protein
MYEGKIPFDMYGTPIPYVWGKWHAEHNRKYVWEDNEVFEAKLKFKRFQRGRSAAHAIYTKVDDESWEVTMFMTDLKDVIDKGFAPLYLTGRFEYVKRGTNFGVKLVEIS